MSDAVAGRLRRDDRGAIGGPDTGTDPTATTTTTMTTTDLPYVAAYSGSDDCRSCTVSSD